MMIPAYAALEPRALLQPFSYMAPELGAHDVELEVSHCGLCYSDIHLIDDDWKKSRYPLVPGHEVVGRVIRRGAEVTHLEVGQRVGVGWQHSACLCCELCVSGHENLCPTQIATCVGHHGGLAQRMIADARFALAIPDALDSAVAAPLLCGGVTVYSPMRRYQRHEPRRGHRHRWARPHGDRDPERDGRRDRRVLVVPRQASAGAADGRA
jgi:uncharacterized zinc-type alcohol dehydrogenase-like protein